MKHYSKPIVSPYCAISLSVCIFIAISRLPVLTIVHWIYIQPQTINPLPYSTAVPGSHTNLPMRHNKKSRTRQSQSRPGPTVANLGVFMPRYILDLCVCACMRITTTVSACCASNSFHFFTCGFASFRVMACFCKSNLSL